MDDDTPPLLVDVLTHPLVPLLLPSLVDETNAPLLLRPEELLDTVLVDDEF